MPLYEFECPSCQHTFEEIVFSTRSGQVQCPECGHDEPRRLMSTFATRGDGVSSFASGSSSSSCGGSGGFS